MSSSEIIIDNQYVVYDADVIENVHDISFDANVLQSQASVTHEAEGRGKTLFYQCAGLNLVLRHYHRGGLIASLLSDRYFWFGLKHTRVWREWHLLKHMDDLGLPVPKPVAYRVQRSGLIYRADILFLQLENTQTLAQKLKTELLSQQLWQNIGVIIRDFHNAGIYHADLNAHNILINTSGKVFLIDFDKGYIRSTNQSWQQSNLQRLQRSLVKLRHIHSKFNYQPEGWEYLLKGYSQ